MDNGIMIGNGCPPLTYSIGGKVCQDDFDLLEAHYAGREAALRKRLRASEAENARLLECLDEMQWIFEHMPRPDLPRAELRRRWLRRRGRLFFERMFNPGPIIYLVTLLIAAWHFLR